ncbi:MAG: UTP--glucose-1-phosphate uridylyltransferase [Planctomycetales bacterium]|nr:UTP--glucose-1-phosphate uridylyltransferase [Planctomycetales bacterium]
MSAPLDKQELLSRLEPFDQHQLLDWWDDLTDEGKVRLAGQIAALDLPLIDSLYRGKLDQPDWAELARRAEPPPAVRLAQRKQASRGELGATPDEARQRGIESLRAGKLGVVLTAGGQGTRLGFGLPKSLYAIGPISSASLLQIHIEKIRALARRYDVAVPLYLMTSPATHDDTVGFLAENQHFGLDPADLVVFCQGTMPAVDVETGKLLLADRDRLFLSPDGHGGLVAALKNSGAFEHMRQRGIEHLFYLQVDNPLVPIGDAELIGYHLSAQSELTSLAIAKQQPHERLGNFMMIDGRLHVVEYSDLPDDVAELRNKSGDLKFWAGSIAVHIFDRLLFERSASQQGSLPFHIARKKVPYLDTKGNKVKPQKPNALKFEKFVFDLLPEAKRPIVVEYAERDCFAPLKNAPGAAKDTEQYVQQLMLAQHRRWLEAAGAHLTPNAKVEISPLFALDAAELPERIEPGQEFNEPVYLR